ncbi:MAG TPA: DUF86 domain-containing protein [Rhizomicrobium sp.]|jgi:uncharacterized protein with HEPN domain|nr:DUF86 domain-containing protein [Rhizomicrobium sp.]
MPSREWQFRILDMLDCIAKVRTYTKNLSQAGLANDDKTVDAILHNIEIIGEASRHVPKRIYEKYPEIRWIDIRGMRNIIAHSYFGIDLRIVWRVATRDLLTLEKQLKALRDAEDF